MTPRSPGRVTRVGVFLLSVVVIGLAAFLVPMPLSESAPGGAVEVAPLVEVDAPTTELNGTLSLLTARVDQPSIVEVVRAMVDDDRTLGRRDRFVPPTVEQRIYVELQQEEFRRAFRVAAAVGLRTAGLEVELDTAAQVVGVLPDGPSDGQLEVGDVIRSFRGTTVATAEELVEVSRGIREGERVSLEVTRAGRTVEVEVVAGDVPGLDRPGLGITLQTLEEDIDLPVDVELVDQRGIGGPSAGLTVALAVHDLVAEEDLLGGRVVVGTGTVEGDGAVGRIGAIPEKTISAIAAGADLMLVPAGQAGAARRAAEGRVEVVGVATVQDAIEALRAR